MSENLYTLPQSWAWKKFGDILHVERGGSPRPIDDYITTASDGINWIKIGDTKNSTKYIYETAEKIKPEGLKKSRLVVEGDFILSNSMSFGKPYIMKTTGCIHDGWLLLRPKNDNLDKEFLYYVLGSAFVYEQFKNKASGTTVKNLNSSLVKDVDIPLPPIQEQRRIVGKLDGLFAKIDKSIALLDESIASASALMPSALNEVFEELGEKWEKKKLDSFVKTTSGGTPLRSTKLFWNGNIPWLKSGELNDGLITQVEEFITEDGLNHSSAKIFKKGTLLMAMYGATAGKLGFLDFDSSTNQAICAILNDEDVSNSKFIYYFLLKDRNKIIKDSFGGAQPNISQNYIRAMEIPLPPLDIQTQTVAYLDALHVKADALKKAQQTKKEELLALKASLLESAFKGEL